MSTNPQIPTYLPGDVIRLENEIKAVETDKDNYIGGLKKQLALARAAGFQPQITELQNRIEAAPGYYDTSLKQKRKQLEEAKTEVDRLQSVEAEITKTMAEAKREGQKLVMKNAWLQGGGSEAEFESAWPGLLNEALKKDALAQAKQHQAERPVGW